MLMRCVVLIAVAVVAVTHGGSARAELQAETLPSLAPMIDRVSPAVVNISVTGTVQAELPPMFQDPMFRRFFGVPEDLPERRVQAAGSGVVIDAARGHVVTNHHVVANADEIVVVLKDRRRLDAELVGSDPEADVAVLKVEANGLSEIPMGDSDKLRVGDFVVAIGNPFGIGQTATIGMISALQRTGLGIEGYENFIQTDASINPGNSGGALVNQQGELVGLNTAILSQSGGNIGIGFAIPVNMVRSLADQILQHGEVRRGRLGVFIQDLTPDLAEAMGLDVQSGALVSRVVPDSAAAEAGLEAGDAIVGVDGSTIETSAELRNTVGLKQPGETVELEIIRDGRHLDITATLGGAERERERAVEGAAGAKLSGARFAAIPSDHPLHGEVDGVLVAGVQPGSNAADAGLRPGDVVVAANRQPVTSPSELEELARAAGDKPLLLRIRRGDDALFLALR